MLAGGRIHRLLQRRGGPDYHAEVPLSILIPCGNYALKIDGRADGIIKKSGQVVVDEIKGVYRDLRYIEEPEITHLSQARCYAYIYALKEGLSEIGLRITYCHIDTEECKYFHFNYSFQELELMFDELLAQYRKWADFSFSWREKRNSSIGSLSFPFPYRSGQQRLVKGVYNTIRNGKRLFLMAPTGVGKTLAVLYPAVHALGEGLAEKLFYLTAKNMTATAAEGALGELRAKGLKLKSVTLKAKEKTCLLSECSCNPEDCEYAKGHFDRVNDALYDFIKSEEQGDWERLREYAFERRLCPFEFALDLSLFSDLIIGDYNYAFDPEAKLKRFFGDGARGRWIFLIDEAHNLVERAREMYSAELYKDSFLSAKKILPKGYTGLRKSLTRLNASFLAMQKELGDFAKGPELEGLAEELQRAAGYLSDMLDDLRKAGKKPDNELLSFYFDICRFLDRWELQDGNYVNYFEETQDKRLKIKLFCVNPSKSLGMCLNMSVSSIFFSATLLPVSFYMKLLSGDSSDYTLYAPSPFDHRKRGIFLCTDVSSAFKRRGDSEYRRIAEYLIALVKGRKGNYMAFFPSYSFLNEVYERFRLIPGAEEVECLIQDRSMGEEERSLFLSNFYSGSAKHAFLLGFCVMGGIFSEGIDLRGDSLIGAAIVGTGFPQLSRERQILKDYFDSVPGEGFDYAYRFPGMNKVLQAAGRVIRTEEDRGIVALLDERFQGAEYRALFPREWKNIKYLNPKNAACGFAGFWEDDSAFG
ncbi:MAG: ATP-dependent DNA helicase [Lachnospiraceae bacterium]|nr:ATP-dependent DNA helicase [Lachnospiraceae bacterium]